MTLAWKRGGWHPYIVHLRCVGNVLLTIGGQQVLDVVGMRWPKQRHDLISAEIRALFGCQIGRDERRVWHRVQIERTRVAYIVGLLAPFRQLHLYYVLVSPVEHDAYVSVFAISRRLRNELPLVLPIDWHGIMMTMIINGDI